MRSFSAILQTCGLRVLSLGLILLPDRSSGPRGLGFRLSFRLRRPARYCLAFRCRAEVPRSPRTRDIHIGTGIRLSLSKTILFGHEANTHSSSGPTSFTTASITLFPTVGMTRKDFSRFTIILLSPPGMLWRTCSWAELEASRKPEKSSMGSLWEDLRTGTIGRRTLSLTSRTIGGSHNDSP